MGPGVGAPSGRFRSLALALLLVAATAALYGRVAGFDFVWDDEQYVVGNPPVRAGLTSDGVVWAFTTAHASNWHPLTWLSHMLDVELYGMNPAGHHVTNLVLHALNALLLAGLLSTMTGRLWESVVLAALFAVHPLHVESVAWVAERKDLLSTFFGLLSAWTYVAYTRRGGPARYALTAVFLAMGLMAKPMLVTLPLVFLLLDYWPLERMRRGASLVCLPMEKVPLLALSAASSVVTMSVQRSGGAVSGSDVLPIGQRLANALVSYVRYVGKTLWPENLSALYPHPYLPGGQPWSAWQVVGAGLVLVAITVVVFRVARRPYARVGWLWFLGMLVPVIGLVQVGRQAMADRYTYLPLTGLFLIAVWGFADLSAGLRWHRASVRRVSGLIAAAVLSAYAVAAWTQVGSWRDSITLFRRAVQTHPDNPSMHNNLAWILATHPDSTVREPDEAIRLARRASEAMRNRNPNYLDTLAAAYASAGRFERAAAVARAGIDLASAAHQDELAHQIRGRLDLYERGKPYRERPR